MSFQRIGATARDVTQASQSKVGTQHGRTTSGALQVSTSEIAEWLASKVPADIDKAAVSRLSSRGVGVAVKYKTMFPAGAPAYDLAVGCTATGGDRAAALVDMERLLTPAPVRHIEAWLAELSVLTAGRGREGMDAELMVTAYSSRLTKFPADVVKDALTVKTWKWFPAWEELERYCNAKASPRRMMVEALRREDVQEPERRLATPDEKARIRDLISEQFPNVPQSWRDEAERKIAGGYNFQGEDFDAK